MKNFLFVSFLMLISQVSFAQSYTISGFVSDASSGERLMYASVYDKNSKQGCATNEYGFFTLVLKNKDVNLVASFIGYKAFQKEIQLNGDLSLNIDLSPTITLQEVVITDKKADELVQSSQMSVVEMPMQKVKQLPVFMGEPDVMKSLQLLPGVQSGQEGASGIYVRGGGADQNLILLDGVPVYNTDHLFGFFSVFNPDAIASTKLIKGGFPARYGGRLSSVVDIRMKEGNLKKYHGDVSIGLISSKLSVEGPIVKDKTGFLVSARRTYLDVLARPFIRSFSGEDANAGYYFYDVNAKVHHKFGDKDKLFLSVYTGRDKAYAKSEEDYTENGSSYDNKSKSQLFWGNLTSSLRWNHVFSPHVFANTTLIFSDYRFVVSSKYEGKVNNTLKDAYESKFTSGIQDIGGKIDFDLNWFQNHAIKAGGNYLYHTFKPGVSTYSMEDSGESRHQKIGNNNIYANEYSLYIEDNWKYGRFLTNFGLHYSGLVLKKKFYHSLQPRLSTRFLLNEKISIKLAYARMQQYLHLLTNSTIGLPTDLWMPCTENIPPQLSDQIALGATWNINNMFDLNVETFYKKMDNLIAYKQGASFFDISDNWEDKLEVGKGQAYGIEFHLRKNYGKLSGWIGYTLSWAWREFDNLNFGKPYPYKYDRRHDISIALTYKKSEKVDFGMTWVYGTGNAMTLGLARYREFDGKQSYGMWYDGIEYYDSKNAYRAPAYHRLDISANFHKQKKRGKRTWSIGLYNAYNRQNPFYLYFGRDEYNKRQLKQISLFPLIPFIRYSYKF